YKASVGLYGEIVGAQNLAELPPSRRRTGGLAHGCARLLDGAYYCGIGTSQIRGRRFRFRGLDRQFPAIRTPAPDVQTNPHGQQHDAEQYHDQEEATRQVLLLKLFSRRIPQCLGHDLFLSQTVQLRVTRVNEIANVPFFATGSNTDWRAGFTA